MVKSETSPSRLRPKSTPDASLGIFPLAIAFDCELRRPGCALIQAALGGTHGIESRFNVETWIVHLTPGMKLYTIENEEQLRKLVEMSEQAI